MTPSERAIYEERLSGAEKAYHELVTGASIKVLVDQNGERIEFNMASSLRLAAYIAELKRILGRNAVSGPLRFIGK